MQRFNECYMPIAWKLQVPIIGTSAPRPRPDVDWQIGNPHPLIAPFQTTNFGQKMNFYERLQNTYSHLMSITLNARSLSALGDHYRLYAPDYDIEMNKNHPSLMFVNTHVSVFPRALLPTVVEVAGIHLTPLNSLTQVPRRTLIIILNMSI